MSQKSELQALVVSLQASVDAVKAAVELLSEGDVSVEDLQKKILELSGSLSEANSKLDLAKAEVAKDEALLSEELSKEAKLQSKIDAIKSVLDS